MATSVAAPSLDSGYDSRFLNDRDFDECSEISQDDDHVGSDYSLSDIEDALEKKSNAARPRKLSVLPSFPVDIDIPVKISKRPAPPLCDVISNGKATPVKCRRRLSSGGSRKGDGSRPNSATGKWIRRRSTKLSVKKQTAQHGLLQIAHLFENAEDIQKTPEDEQDRVPNMENDFPPRFIKRANTVGVIKNFAKDETVTPKRKIPNLGDYPNGESLHLELLRNRSQSHSGLLDSPRSRSSSVLSNRSLKTDTEGEETLDKDSNRSLRQWKHYKRAMEAYRKSAEKSKAAATSPSPQSTDDANKTNSLPLRGQSVFERVSIYDLWDTRSRSSTPTAEECSVIAESPTAESIADSDSLQLGDDVQKWCQRNHKPTPIKKYGCKCEEPNPSLSLDYRNVVRRTPSRNKGGWTLLRQSFRRNNNRSSMRKSMEPDPITDIDAMIGFSDYKSPKRDSLTDEPVSSFDMIPEPSTEQDSVPKRPPTPEKIVWSEYQDYIKVKAELSEFPRTSFKMRLAVLEKKGVKTKGLADIICKEEVAVQTGAIPARKLSEDRQSQNDLNDINLRNNNEIIRKRNLSLSSNSLQVKEHHKSVEHISVPSHRLPEFGHYHTIASPARLSRMLKKKAKKLSLLSPLSSPHIAGGKTDKKKTPSPQRRTTSLTDQCKYELDKDHLAIISTEDGFDASADEVFSLPSPAPRPAVDDMGSMESFQFPSPPKEFCGSVSPRKITPLQDEPSVSKNISSETQGDNADQTLTPSAFDTTLQKSNASSPNRLTDSRYQRKKDKNATQKPSISSSADFLSACVDSANDSSANMKKKRSSWLYANAGSPFACYQEGSAGATATNLTYMDVRTITPSVSPDVRRKQDVPKIKITKSSVRQSRPREEPVYNNIPTPAADPLYLNVQSGCESEDDYVSYDQFYNDIPIKGGSKGKRNDEDTLNRADILQEDMSKLDLDIEGYFASLGRKKPTKSLKASPHRSTPVRNARNTKSCQSQQLSKYVSRSPVLINSNANNSSTKAFSNGMFRPSRYSRDSNASSVLSTCSSSRSSCVTPSPISTPVAEHIQIFESGDFSDKRKRKRKSKRSHKKAAEISVPLTDSVLHPDAAYQLNLEKRFSSKTDRIDLISSFINNDSIQQVGKICEMFESKSKQMNTMERKAYSDGLFSSMSRILKLRKVKTKTAKSREQSIRGPHGGGLPSPPMSAVQHTQHHQAPPPAAHNVSYTPPPPQATVSLHISSLAS
uniref:Uncharacterized protein LOC104266813 n=1 Tax=Phallusia mammillata TaxID=59560 RepID=A0A6F9DJW7_9ASCI|nr:uncharacterized protein LOC104266813 [Phallusia mammillata]